MKKGHSNVDAKRTTTWPNADHACAAIPLCGGASYSSYKELPPLALHKDEWEEIGIRMGWMPKEYLVKKALSKGV